VSTLHLILRGFLTLMVRCDPGPDPGEPRTKGEKAPQDEGELLGGFHASFDNMRASMALFHRLGPSSLWK